MTLFTFFSYWVYLPVGFVIWRQERKYTKYSLFPSSFSPHPSPPHLSTVWLFQILCYVSGNIGPELSYTDISVFISSDGGNTWRQVTGRFGDREEGFGAISAKLSPSYRFSGSLGLCGCKEMETAAQLGQLGQQIRWPIGSNGKPTGQGIGETGIFSITSFFYSATVTRCEALCWLLEMQPIKCFYRQCAVESSWQRGLFTFLFVSLPARWRG